MNNIIRYLREKHNYSQSQVAEALDVSRQAYIKYETGEVEPPVAVVRRLSRLYSVSYKELIDDAVPATKDVTYKIRDSYSLNVAEPSASFDSTTSLVSQLAYIKMLLNGFEAQLKKEKQMKTKSNSALKPRLNIAEFLAATKPVHIDGSYVEQLRSESMERSL